MSLCTATIQVEHCEMFHGQMFSTQKLHIPWLVCLNVQLQKQLARQKTSGIIGSQMAGSQGEGLGVYRQGAK
jgi:hypothetical protein